MSTELMRNAVINEMKWERKILRTGVKVSRSTPIGIEQLFFIESSTLLLCIIVGLNKHVDGF